MVEADHNTVSVSPSANSPKETLKTLCRPSLTLLLAKWLDEILQKASETECGDAAISSSLHTAINSAKSVDFFQYVNKYLDGDNLEEAQKKVVTDTLEKLVDILDQCFKMRIEPITELGTCIMLKLFSSGIMAVDQNDHELPFLAQKIILLIYNSADTLICGDNDQVVISVLKCLLLAFSTGKENHSYDMPRDISSKAFNLLRKICINSDSKLISKFGFNTIVEIFEHLVSRQNQQAFNLIGELTCESDSKSFISSAFHKNNCEYAFTILKLLSQSLKLRNFTDEFKSAVKSSVQFLVAGLTSNHEVLTKAICIFLLELIVHGRQYFKKELDILMSSQILCFNSSLTPSNCKIKIMEFWIDLFKYPEICIELYMNYDCDADSSFDIMNHILMCACDLNINDFEMMRLNRECIIQFLDTVYEWNFCDVSSSTASINECIKFEQMKDYKANLEYGFSIFNKNYSAGLEYFAGLGVCSSEPESIAHFVVENINSISKSQLGEYFGNPSETSQAVLRLFLKQIHVQASSLVVGLRHLLTFFKLPGESQKIDRIMNAFAEVFCEKFNGNFSTDSVYILSYAIIMLNTDLHNPKVLTKISKKEFLKNSKFIMEMYEIEEIVLDQIYEEIHSEAIYFSEDFCSSPNKKIPSSSTERSIAFEFSPEKIILRASELLQKSPALNSVKAEEFFKAIKEQNFKEIILPSVKCLNNAFNIFIQIECESTQIKTIYDSLFKLACILTKLELIEELHGLVSAVCISIEEKKSKCFIKSSCSEWFQFGYSLKFLLNVAEKHGNFFLPMWLAFFDSIATGNHFGMFDKRSCLDTGPLYNSLDKFFSSTAELDEKNISELVNGLCNASRNEILLERRTFFLERLLETVHYNTHRVKYEWFKIWAVVSNFFIECFRDSNQTNILKFVVDSLRQLSFKFLEDSEYLNSSFQKDFLFTFSEILENTSNMEVIELILNCLYQIAVREGPKIKSGWYSIFKCLEVTYRKAGSTPSTLYYQLWKECSHEYFDSFVGEKCLLSYRNVYLNLLKSKYSTKQKTVIVEIYRSNLEKFYRANGPNDPIFRSLMQGQKLGCLNGDLEVRSMSLNVIFSYLNYELKNSEFFREYFDEYFLTLFNVLLKDEKLFDCADDKEEYVKTTLIGAFRSFCILFSTIDDNSEKLQQEDKAAFVKSHQIKEYLFEQLLALVEIALNYEDESIVNMGYFCLKELFESYAKLQFSIDHAEKINHIGEIITAIIVNNRFPQLLADFLNDCHIRIIENFSNDKLFDIMKLLKNPIFCSIQYEMSKQLYSKSHDTDHQRFLMAQISECFEQEAKNFLIPRIIDDANAELRLKIFANIPFYLSLVSKFIRSSSSLLNYREFIATFLQNLNESNIVSINSSPAINGPTNINIFTDASGELAPNQIYQKASIS